MIDTTMIEKIDLPRSAGQLPGIGMIRTHFIAMSLILCAAAPQPVRAQVLSARG